MFRGKHLDAICHIIIWYEQEQVMVTVNFNLFKSQVLADIAELIPSAGALYAYGRGQLGQCIEGEQGRG